MAAYRRMRAVPGTSPGGTTEMIKRALLFARRLPGDLLPWLCGMAARAVSGRRAGRREFRPLPGAITAATLALLAAVDLAQASSEIVHYDPSQCSTDPEGTVTIALGRVVLRVPMDALSSIADLPPQERAVAPVPPDPSQPQGCPDHPMIGRAFYFRYLSDAVQDGSLSNQPLSRRIDRLALIAVRPDFWGLQPSHERRFRQVCTDYQLRRESGNGLQICHVRPNDTERPERHWPFVAQAPLSRYVAPFDRPFTAYCTWGSRPGTHQCDVDYKLYDTMNVAYRFEPGRLPLDDLIDFDRGLRAWIESVRVDGFVWPDERNADGDGT